jgi:uncharacterized protein YndB with AHSA1/START domain
MPSGSLTTDFAASPERIWAVISDIESAPQWVPDMLSSRRVDSGPLGKGSRFEQVMRVQGRRVTATVEIVEYAEGKTMAHTGQGGPVKFGGRFELTPTESGCSVTNSWWLELSGMLRLASPVAASWARKNIEDSMSALRKLLETNSSAG